MEAAFIITIIITIVIIIVAFIHRPEIGSISL